MTLGTAILIGGGIGILWLVVVRAFSEKARAHESNREFGCMVMFIAGVFVVIALAVDHLVIGIR